MTIPKVRKRPFHFKNVRPIDPAVTPIGQWSKANYGFYERFRKWITESDCSASTLNIYSVGARFALGLLDKPYWAIDPDEDLDLVYDHLADTFPEDVSKRWDEYGRLAYYLKGVRKLEQYLRLTQEKAPRPKQVNWPHYVGALPDWLAKDVRGFLRHRRRAWPQERIYESSITTLSHLTLWLRWLAREGKIRKLNELNPQNWFAYVDARLAAGISPVTLNGELAELLTFLHFLRELGRKVSERMLQVRRLPEQAKLPKDVPPEQLQRLQQLIEETASVKHTGIRRMALMDLAWFLLMLHCGLRTGEVRRLTLEDLDLSQQRVRIEKTKGLRERLVPLSPAAMQALVTYLEVRGPAEALPEEVFIFRHQPLSRSYCGQRLKTYGKACGVRITPHQLRHSCATLLLNAGAPVTVVQSILGHKHVDTTMSYARVYDGTVAADYYRAMDTVNDVLRTVKDDVAPSFSRMRVIRRLDRILGGRLEATKMEDLLSLRNELLILFATETAEL